MQATPLEGDDARRGRRSRLLDWFRSLFRLREPEERAAQEARSALLDSAVGYRFLMETSSDGILTVDARGHILFANPAASHIFGYDEEELTGRPLAVLMPDALRAPHAESMQRYVRTGERTMPWDRVQLRGLRKDGTELPIELSFGVFRLRGGLVFSGFVRDITKRRQAEEERDLARASLDRTADPAFWLGHDLSILYANDLACRMLGYSRTELAALDLGAIDPTWPGPRWSDRRHRLRTTGTVTFESRFKTREGNPLCVQVTLSTIHMASRECIFALARDITAIKLAERELRESEERYKLAAEGTDLGFWDWNIRAGQVYYTPTCKQVLGYAVDDQIASLDAWLSRVHPEDLPGLRAALEGQVRDGARPFTIEHRLRVPGGNWRWIVARGVPVLDEQGRAGRVTGSLSDISDRKIVEDRLVHDALHDALTGLPNRALFLDRLDHGFRKARRRDGTRSALLFMDLDRFKQVNDSLGHAAGDALLVGFARRVGSCLRPEDTLARLGGDEFAVLLDAVDDVGEAEAAVSRIRAALEEPFLISGREIQASASIGVALDREEYEAPADLLRDADTAMYHAKHEGRGRHAVWSPELTAEGQHDARLEEALTEGLAADAFEAHYQPILDLRTGKIAGFEALARWRHPERGLLLPSEFIAEAEATGLIREIGGRILERACTRLRDWQDRYPTEPPRVVSVNVSAGQIRNGDVVERVRRTLASTGLPPGTLWIEMTEGVIIEDPGAASEILADLKSLGVKLLLDDFGQGYASLAHLHRFPIDILKIERDFVAQLDAPESRGAMVRTICSLGEHLGLTVIAEGIETPRQLDRLKELGCDFGQGYHLARPAAARDIALLLASAAVGRPAVPAR